MVKEKVAAIIPAYNESERIANVVSSIKKSRLIDEIIVIDDGSTDDTYEKIKKFKKIKVIRNRKNLGKSGAIDVGISSTNAEIIFLCDSDLKRFTPVMADKIILPVLSNETNLSIGLRNIWSYKLIKKLHLNSAFLFISGQRAFRKEIWENLSEFYKKGYRLEMGMNYLAKKKFNGFSFILLNYTQTVKESKSGIIRGTLMRWKMNLDLVKVFFRFNFYDNFRIK